MKNSKTLPIGTTINSGQTTYYVEQVLGQGGFGITYKVTATLKFGKIAQKGSFAMKEHFLSEYCERENTTNRVQFSAPVKDKVDESLRDFIAEARRLNTLDHPNIVAVNEVFETNDTAYYVMEYIEGKSLRHYIENHGILTEEQVLTVITPILNAVSYLHDNRMTHLDIKPDNIMMRPDENSEDLVPVLIDFGLSKHYDEQGRPTSTIRIQGCSQGYAPVEQYLGINSFSPTADVYALAATLYYLLVGEDPIIASELNQEGLASSLPSSLSEHTRNAICNAMHMAKAKRTQSVAEFAKALGITLSTGSTTSVSASSFTQQINHSTPENYSNSIVITDNDTTKNKNRWLAPTLISVIILLLGIGAFLLIGNRDVETEEYDDEIIAETQIPEPEIPNEELVVTTEEEAQFPKLPTPSPIVDETNSQTIENTPEQPETPTNTTITQQPIASEPEPELDPARVYDFASIEQPAQFPGGEEALYKFIGGNLRYPVNAQENGIQGRVVVQFVVTKTGEVGEVRVVRSKDPDLDKEAVRVVKSLPNFIPGKQNGRPVNVWFTLPIRFKLQE